MGKSYAKLLTSEEMEESTQIQPYIFTEMTYHDVYNPMRAVRSENLKYIKNFEHEKIINLSEEDYGDPEKVGREISKNPKVESVDICTGEHELFVKLRTKDSDEYYELIKRWVKKFKVKKIVSITSLKQLKTEFVEID